MQSLRRIIEKEIELNGKGNSDEFSNKIKSFAENNLYGIDINPNALKVTCFSIYIALLDYLEPADINIYQFPTLIDNNLFEANFFGKLNDNNELEPSIFEDIIKQVKPKFILGNPPWKKDNSKEHLSWVNKSNTYSKKIIGKFEIAQSFLLKTKEFMQEDTICSLIVTSTIFFNISATTKEFKKDFLTSFKIDNFFDLSPVRRLIFAQKSSPATVIKFKLSKENDYKTNIIKHQSIKSNIFLKNFKMLVIEKFDQKQILQSHFLKNDWMFKVALYGNTLDFHLLNKIIQQDLPSILDLTKDNWLHSSSGILSGTPKNHFKTLVGLPLNENSSIKRYYTENSNYILKPEDVYLEAGRDIKNFNSDKILIKEQAENESELVISYNENPSVFKKGVFGLSSNKSSLLKQLYSFLISDLYQYFIFSISGSWGTSTRPQIRWKEEFLSFPLVNTDDKTQNTLLTLVDETINPIKEFYQNQKDKSEVVLKNQQKAPVNHIALDKVNKIINSLYKVNEYEIDLINYVLNVSRYQFQESKQNLFLKPVNNKLTFLSEYADVFLKEFGSIYSDEYIQVEIYPLKHFIAMNFVMKKDKPEIQTIYPKNTGAESVLKTLANTLSISTIFSSSNSENNLYIQKDIKGFEDHSFYIIKPNEYKCWHRAMAWYDVAEFKEAIQTAELNHLNNSI